MAELGRNPVWGRKARLLLGLGVFLGQGSSGEYCGYFINLYLSLINAWTATYVLCLLLLLVSQDINVYEWLLGKDRFE